MFYSWLPVKYFDKFFLLAFDIDPSYLLLRALSLCFISSGLDSSCTGAWGCAMSC